MALESTEHPEFPIVADVPEIAYWHPSSAAVQAVRRLAASGPLLQAVGARQVDALLACVVQAETALLVGGPDGAHMPELQKQQVQALYALARQCLGLLSTADTDEPVGVPRFAALQDREHLDLGWSFGVEVAEVTAHGLAAIATGLDFCVQTSPEQALEGWAIDVLERLGLDFDYFSAFLFGGLSRLGAGGHHLNPDEQRLFRALRGTCVWAMWAVGHGIGYHNFSGKVLWEWTSEDAVWALIMSKGVLLTSYGDLAELQAPPGCGCADAPVVLPGDLSDLQLAVCRAVLDLSAPQVPFKVSTGSNDIPMASRNSDLAFHRAELASACVHCRLVDVLIGFCAQKCPALAARLAAFLVHLLQPELTEDQIEADILMLFSFASAQIVEEAQKASTILVGYLMPLSNDLWHLLAQVPAADQGNLRPGFLQDCADLAYFLPPSRQVLNSFIDACVSARAASSVANPTSEAMVLASLCVLSSNARISPEGGAVGMACEALVQALMYMQADSHSLLLQRWERWRGPVRLAQLGQWASVFSVAPLLPLKAPPAPKVEACPLASTLPVVPKLEAPPLPSSLPVAPQPPLLRELVKDAPAEYRCAFDGQLMMDPVVSPQGLVFERMVIANALSSSAGQCPVSRQPLALADCKRLPDLRKRIAKWIRERPAGGKKQPELVAAVLGADGGL